MVLTSVTIPDDLHEGEQMLVAFGGGEFLVEVPSGCRGGDVIEVDFPVADAPSDCHAADADASLASPPSSQLVRLVVPDGMAGGDCLTVEAPWGALLDVVLPDGCRAGEEVELELREEGRPQEAPARCGGVYQPGERVSVLRSNGAYTPGCIKEFEEMSGTYTVELEGGLLKYLVDEDSIAPLDFQPEQAGEHFVGRRVQVPTVGALSKDDVTGSIRSFDARTGLYVVDMDNGKARRNVRAEEIRVRPDRRK